MRAVRAVISHCTSDMSQCLAEGDKTQTPQETNFSIKLSPSPALQRNWFCVSQQSLWLTTDWFQSDSTEDNPANELFDLHNNVCGCQTGCLRKHSLVLEFSTVTELTLCFNTKKGNKLSV